MCGIVVIAHEGGDNRAIEGLVAQAGRAQKHRGPDDEGAYVHKDSSGTVVGLGHQRLAILDLSPRAHQPMISPDGRYVLVYNGEVYNYQDLAKELPPSPILDMSTSDTAVVLAALEHWGTEAPKRFNGMWALALLDTHKGTLFLSRDRFGIKPLYYYQEGGKLIVTSEVKAILSVAERRFKLNPNTVGKFLFQSLTNSNQDTFFDGITAFPTGSSCTIDIRQSLARPLMTERYWRHPVELGGNVQHDDVAPEDIKDVFDSAVHLRLRSDVPVGILLSGGLDSSSILAATCTSFEKERVTTLSAVSNDPLASEERYIDIAARHFNIVPKKLNVDNDPKQLLDDLSNLCWFSDQPVSGMPPAAHRQLMIRAKKLGLTVLLTGQGADEQLGGYRKFLFFFLRHCLSRRQLAPVLSMLGGRLFHRTISPGFNLSEAKRYLPGLRGRVAGRLAGTFLDNISLEDTGFRSSYQEREWLDIAKFSVPVLLHYEDRMSMSTGVEMRVPFLDHRLVEMLARVRPSRKLSRGWTKWIFRTAMKDALPEEITWRKDKRGFSLPTDNWLRNEYYPTIEKMFAGRMMAEDLEIVQPGAPKRLLNDYVNGRLAVGHKDVFGLFCLEVWLQRFAAYIRK